MKIVEPSVEILFPEELKNVLKKIEIAARTCYKSEDAITEDSAKSMVAHLSRNGHGAMLEHADISVRVVCDRGVTHEIVRHRVASYAQESTRYCNYSKGKFGSEITVIRPLFFADGTPEYLEWLMACQAAEKAYLSLISAGRTPQEARSVLPTSLKTEIIIKMNIREWIHFFNLRAVGKTGKPHPQMEQVASMILEKFNKELPELFSGVYEDYEWRK